MFFKKNILLLLTVFLTFNQKVFCMKENNTGFLCTIEGIDGAGKSTLLANLKKLFIQTDITTFFTKEPGATNLGKKLRAMILEQEVKTCPISEFLLFAADRAQHFQDFIIPQLQQGNLIISDRMADSSLAYQGYLKGINIEMITMINTWCMQQLQPDVTIYLKISADDAKKRIAATRGISDKFEQESLKHLEKLVNAFDTIFSKRATIIIVDATQDAQTIAESVFKQIVELYQKKQDANK
jgi:dTMP kinase